MGGRKNTVNTKECQRVALLKEVACVKLRGWRPDQGGLVGQAKELAFYLRGSEAEA